MEKAQKVYENTKHLGNNITMHSETENENNTKQKEKH